MSDLWVPVTTASKSILHAFSVASFDWPKHLSMLFSSNEVASSEPPSNLIGVKAYFPRKIVSFKVAKPSRCKSLTLGTLGGSEVEISSDLNLTSFNSAILTPVSGFLASIVQNCQNFWPEMAMLLDGALLKAFLPAFNYPFASSLVLLTSFRWR